MKNEPLKGFKRRWEKVAAFEKKESRNLSAARNLRQFASIMKMAAALGIELKEDKEKLNTRKRWIFLKKAGNEKFA